jgi:hypothetical protein
MINSANVPPYHSHILLSKTVQDSTLLDKLAVKTIGRKMQTNLVKSSVCQNKENLKRSGNNKIKNKSYFKICIKK